MSHYYLAAPKQLQEALDRHCSAWEPQQAATFKKQLQDFLDSPVSMEARIRVDVADISLPTVGVAGEKPR